MKYFKILCASFFLSFLFSKQALQFNLKNTSNNDYLVEFNLESFEIETIGYRNPLPTEKYGGIQLPGPNIIDFANARSLFGHHKYSLCLLY